ncbi:MAG: uroporphyrinogen-III synthase [Chlorobi bacterium]|nr:uroporphyrinogen-III synthase [Chlorobiota bacterium]
MMIDKKIIFTAPAVYSRHLFDTFAEAGFTNILTSPVIITKLVEDDSVYESLFKDFFSNDFVILPSRNAIDAFVKAAWRKGFSLQQLKDMQYATIGSDSAYLELSGLQTSLKTKEPSTGGIVDALRKIKRVKKITVLVPEVKIIPEPDIIPGFIKELKTIASLNVIRAYVTMPNDGFSKNLLSDIMTGSYDLVAFTSGGEIEALKYILKNDDVFETMRVACFGPYTASTAERNGLLPVVTGSDFSSFAGFANAIRNYFTC